jgi:UDP-N-acetylmuramyl pentapeptide phosphotransferase/UDP-N-acetylglucosamine-1-phosphate transferase
VSTPSYLSSGRRRPLSREAAASRISAYVYGNILVLAALVPITTTPQYVGIAIVLGTALSTFIAHAFAESVSQSVRSGQQLSRSERIEELRDSVPILSSAVLPCLILLTAWLGWIEPRTAQILAEITVLIRIGSTIFVVRRLQGRRPTTRTVVTAVGLALIATVVVVVKVVLTH